MVGSGYKVVDFGCKVVDFDYKVDLVLKMVLKMLLVETDRIVRYKHEP